MFALPRVTLVHICPRSMSKWYFLSLLISAASPLLSQIHPSCAALQFKSLKAQTAWKILHPGEFMNGVLAGSVTAT